MSKDEDIVIRTLCGGLMVPEDSAYLALGKHASVFARSIMEYSSNNNRSTEIV